ncbi:energy-coupling factor transporter transmembrane component T [Janibacter sp. G349]|uniref:energy-coupling factor transporter transmembrane component T n=1 Tax=Janibacter sp. G349 TaxID=3405424 RepID=UPI003B807F66
MLLTAHRPGTSLVHRLPAGAKLSLLAAAGVGLALADGWPSAGLAAGTALALLVVAGTPLRVLVAALRGPVLVTVALGVWLTWQAGWPRAGETVGDLLALVLLASLVTTTTRVDDMLDAVERAMRPLRRFGVRADRVALAISLALRAVPATAEVATETRDAARARGLERNPRAILTPFVVRVVRDARLRGEALHARGVGDDQSGRHG